MNPKDMTNECLLHWHGDTQGVDEDNPSLMKAYGEIYYELLRRLDEADALRKENEELKAQNLLIRGDNADLLANADAYSFNISNMHTKMLQLLEENAELRKDKGGCKYETFNNA